MMHLVRCTYDQHAAAILAILNEAIVSSTALYDYKPRPAQRMVDWFASRDHFGFPVLGYEDDAGTLLGFATYGEFRSWPAYKYTVEHSVYVHKDHRGQGIGIRLMQELIAFATANSVHVMVGVVDTSNTGSVALHEKLGFRLAGTIHQAGFKFGRWLDVAFYERQLPSPETPVEG